MNSNELREACEMAGLECRDHDTMFGPAFLCCVEGLWYPSDNKPLFAYVAELLTAKVRERGRLPRYNEALGNETSDALILATADQRIRAAMAVLKGGGA